MFAEIANMININTFSVSALFQNTAVIFKGRQEIADNHSETLLPIQRIFIFGDRERSG